MQRAPFTLQGRSMHRSRCTAVPAARRTARDAHGAAVMHARLAAQRAPHAAQRCSAYSLPCCAPRYLLHRCSAHRAARGFVTMRAPLAVQRCSEHRSLTRPAVQRLPRYLQRPQPAARNVAMELRRSRCRGAAVPRCSGTRARRSLCRTAVRDARRSVVHWVSRAGQRCSRGEHYPTCRTRRASSQTAEGSCHVS